MSVHNNIKTKKLKALLEVWNTSAAIYHGQDDDLFDLRPKLLPNDVATAEMRPELVKSPL